LAYGVDIASPVIIIQDIKIEYVEDEMHVYIGLSIPKGQLKDVQGLLEWDTEDPLTTVVTEHKDAIVLNMTRYWPLVTSDIVYNEKPFVIWLQKDGYLPYTMKLKLIFNDTTQEETVPLINSSQDTKSSSWWIDSFQLINEDEPGDYYEKGKPLQARLVLKNPYIQGDIGPIYTQFYIKEKDTNVYTGWNQWIKAFTGTHGLNTGKYIPAAYFDRKTGFIIPGTLYLTVNVGPVLHDTDQGYWALNAQEDFSNDYYIYTDVYAPLGFGTLTSDTLSTYIFNYLTGTNENHNVLVVYFTNSQWYTEGYANPATKITEASTYFSNAFSVTLHPVLELSWDPDPETFCEDLMIELKEIAGDMLHLASDWNYPNPSDGTDPDNHGFDVCAGFTAHWSDHVGMGEKPGNVVVITGGSRMYGNRLNDPEVENIFQHESSHCYGADDHLDFETWDDQPSVMSKPIGLFFFNNWGYSDYAIMYTRRGQFNGI